MQNYLINQIASDNEKVSATAIRYVKDYCEATKTLEVLQEKLSSLVKAKDAIEDVINDIEDEFGAEEAQKMWSKLDTLCSFVERRISGALDELDLLDADSEDELGDRISELMK